MSGRLECTWQAEAIAAVLRIQSCVRTCETGSRERETFLVALILGVATALFIYRDRLAAWFPKGENLPDNLGLWQTQATITILVVLALAYMLSD